MAAVFQRQARYRAWESLHDEFMANIRSDLPPEDERPSVIAVWRGVDPTSGQFYLSDIHKYHNQTKPLSRLGLRDGYDAEIPGGGTVGYEELLNHDPDYIAAVGRLTTATHDEFVTNVVEPFENNPNGQDLTAVQEGNIIRIGGQYQGPIVDLFATEPPPSKSGPIASASGQVLSATSLTKRNCSIARRSVTSSTETSNAMAKVFDRLTNYAQELPTGTRSQSSPSLSPAASPSCSGRRYCR